jgi:hypothetical protein
LYSVKLLADRVFAILLPENNLSIHDFGNKMRKRSVRTTMGWALLLLLGVVLAVHWWEYRNAIQEYSLAQPASLEKHDELRSVLAEKTPLAVEVGALPWRPEVADKSAWTVTVGEEEETQLEMSIQQWLKESPRPEIQNCEDLAGQMDLGTGLADVDAARAWWWLPGLWNTRIDVLAPAQVVGLQWVGAERQWIGCSHGGPLTLWLVHSRYRRYLPLDREEPVDPWALTVADTPWIGRVQYIEVKIKPGWCMGLPAHWGYAIRGDNESWWWRADQHSALSWMLTD